MPLWSVEDWRARIGSCWCALGRPFNTRFTRNRGKSRRVLTLHQLLTMVTMVMLLMVAILVLCAIRLKMSSTLFDGGSYWNLHLVQFGLIINISFGVLMIAVQMVYRLLSHQARASLRQFLIDLIHSLWLIGYLTQILTYPIWLTVNSLQNAVGSVIKGISKSLEKCVSGHESPPGSLRSSLIAVVAVGTQLLVSVSISRAVIYLLLMTSGDVERNPGPNQSVIKATGTTCRGTVLMVLLQAMAAVQTSMLMRSGDVETNPGPGLYPDLDYDDVDSSITLKEDDFREVFRCTVDLKACYYEFGIELGLPPQELTTIQHKAISHPLTCVLLAWLSQRYNTEKYGLPTWRRLAEAVDSPSGGNNHELAKAIASKHPTALQLQPKGDKEPPKRPPEDVVSDGTRADSPSDEEAQLSNVSHDTETVNTGDESKHYKEEDLDEIFHRIHDYHGLWKVIGVELGIGMDVLNTIEKDYRQDIDCLHALIIQWPHGDNSSLTYQALIKAFESERASETKAAIIDVQLALTLAWDYHEVWRSLGRELNVGESVLDTIKEKHFGYHDQLRALIEIWLGGARLTDTARETMTNALKSVSVTKALAARPVNGKDVERLFKLTRVHYRLWKLLGTEMGIDMDTLNAIEEEYVGDRDRLHAMIDNAKPAITRGTMAQVLQSQSITKAIADPPLVAGDLNIMFKLTWEYYMLWKIIGAELGIDVDALSSIERGQTTTRGCLRKMINEANPPVTCNAMTRVLQSERITNAVAAILSGTEIGEILNRVRNYSQCWKSIGLELGIDSAALDAIETNYANNHRRLIAMIELWHISVDLMPSNEAMETVLRSNRVTLSEIDSPYHAQGVSLLKHDDYRCESDVMVDGDIFTYPYYWDSGDVVCAVKILHPLVPTKNYFEHKILSHGVVCAITIGLVGSDYPLDRQPGWNEEGIGYHADDGKLFNEDGVGTVFGPLCTTEDRMGCGVVFEGDNSSEYVKVFFTKNDQQVGDFINFRRPKSGLHPFMGFSSRGEQFQYLGSWHHLPDPQEQEHNSKEKKGFEAELNQLLAYEGHVELDISKVIITGAAGSGKTCTKLLLYKLPPPMQRQSTELIEPMERAYIKHEVAYHEEDDSEYEWIVVESGSESLYTMLAATVDSGEYICEHEDTDDGLKIHVPVEKLSSNTTDTEFESNLQKAPAVIRSSELKPTPELSTGNTPSKKDGKQKVRFERQDSKARESLLMKLKSSSDQKGVCVHKVRWIHLVDSGGQSQFHDILPTFLNHTSVIIYVLKLSEMLDAQPFDNYFEHGECLGEARRSHYDVEQILNGVIQSAYYEKHNEGNEKHTTKILIVGTHKDVLTGSESIDAKNSKLKKIFDPFVGSRQLEVLCRGDYNADDIIFPLDAMKRDRESLDTGRDIRKRIISKGSKTHKVPISWFLLEQDLRSVGDEENNGVITIGECVKLAEAISVSKVKSALEYFHSLNIFLYFPHSSALSEIVFTDPQVVVAIVSAFVKEAYQKVTDTEFKDFSERGEFTKSFVKSKLSRFLVPAAGFEEAEVIELLKITLVIAHIEEGRYFMPCILPHCSLDEFEKERVKLEASPVVVKLPGDTQCVPRGFFCALVCGLMQKWKLRKKHGKVADVFKNFVQFTVDGYRVTVADTFYYVEIHVHNQDSDRHVCRKIHEDIGEALKVVVNTHQYNNEIMSSYSLEFLCPCGFAPVHTASTSVTDRKQKLNCTKDDDETFELEEKHFVWLKDEEYATLRDKQGGTIMPQAILPVVQDGILQAEVSGFSETMSDDEFLDYLKKEGLKERDCSKLMDNGVGAKVFTELTNEDIDDKDLGFSFGGRKVLKRVLAEIKENYKEGGLSDSATTALRVAKAVHLTKRDLLTVYKEVQGARSRWYFFGLGLDIDPDDLDPIESLCRGDTEKSLLEVLKIFLRRAEPKPTWQLLADALNSPGVGCEAIAEQLRETWLT